MLQFELTMDNQDIINSQFDMKKYRRRPQNVVTAGGFVKTSQAMPVGLTSSALKPPSSDATKAFNSVGRQAQSHTKDVQKDRGGLIGASGGGSQSLNHM